MDFIQALVLGLIQGITEWLPISSQGQTMVFALAFLGIDATTALSYAVVLHIGTLISAIIFFRRELLEMLQLKDKKLLKFVVIAVIATAVTAAPSYLLLKSVAASTFVVLIVIAVLLILTGIVQMLNKKQRQADLTTKNSILLGLGQGFSVLPGVSRSGTTTSVLLFEGFSPEKAFRLSFLLSVPSVIVAELAFALFEPIVWESSMLVAVVVAAIVGLLSIKILIDAAKRINFGLFCIGFGILYLIIAFLF